MTMLHHLSFAVSDLARSSERVWSFEDAVGYGSHAGQDKFAIKTSDGTVVAPKSGFHTAFAAPSRSAVDAFYRAALENGGRDNGLPGLRPHYGPHYYAAFVVDPDGYEIEAVICEVE